MMAHTYHYCLKCRAPTNLRCQHHEYSFGYSSKLRVPTDTKNKTKFRKFLDECCIFVNLVNYNDDDSLRKEFRKLLIDVKYYDKTMNGFQWTLVKKGDRE